MRRGEVLALGKDQINKENDSIIIEHAWKLPTVIGLPKWDKKREIPVSQKVMKLLIPYLNTDKDLLFSYNDGKRLGETWWHKNFLSAVKDAGIACKERNISPHSLRHSLNTHLISKGCDVILTQAYLGWSSKYQYLTKVQNGYTYLTAIHLEGIAEKIDQIYNNISQLKIVREVSC